MNREIKFRAWDKKYNKIKAIIDIGWNSEQDEIIVWAKDDEEKSYPIIDPILMQYTGLKDKNGKEIYEGDIIQHYVISKGKEYKQGENRIVKWNINRYYSGFNTGEGDNPKRIFKEIIGNIYENKELLK